MIGSYCLENRQTCSKSHYLNNISKCPPPPCTKISEVNGLKQRIKHEWAYLNYAVMGRAIDVAPASVIYVLSFVL